MRPINRLGLIYVAFIVMGLFVHSAKGSPLLMLVVLVAIKTIADVSAHWRARNPGGAQAFED